MNSNHSFINIMIRAVRELAAVVCIGVLVPGSTALAVTQEQPPASDSQAAKLPPEQLDSLVAPIALYPDPMLSQTLVASTYPLEVILLQQWLAQNKGLNEKQLADAVKKQDWDPSIQGLAALPDVVKLLSENIKWTTDLGNAFLAQQSDVMDAVQRMRKKAQDAGNLKSSEQQKVEVKTVESKQVIVVEQANPQVVYVPSYNPTVVYGAPLYAYPPIAYPPPGYYAAGMAISFGVGVAMGAMWSGGWGYNSGWGGNNNVTINNNNNFVNNSNRQNINNGNRGNARPISRQGATVIGSTTRSTAAERRMATETRRISLVAPHVATPCKTGRPTLGRTKPVSSRREGAICRIAVLVRAQVLGTWLTAELAPVPARATCPTVGVRAIWGEAAEAGPTAWATSKSGTPRVPRTETRLAEPAAA